MGNEQPTRPNPNRRPMAAKPMNTAIKQRLQRQGNAKSTYNMKVVIRGDRQTGKSALFHRLEGGGFIKEHRTTQQIQCAHVLWPYKSSDEMVNLEIWDVVDKAVIPSNVGDDGSISMNVSKHLLPADATTIDVFKGVHAVIFMVDPTRKWTLEYVKKNISSIPNGIDCVLLFGKKDLSHNWTLSANEISEFMSAQPKNIRHIEVSLADCYGMKELHSFFNVPFLRMKAKYLQQELDRAQREYEQSKVELDIFLNHQNYDEFLKRLRTLKEHKNAKHSKSMSMSPSPSSPTLKAKQTVTLSKDLPLIQEQHQKQKENEEKEKEKEKKKNNIKDKEVDIDSFKPSGGLNDDFFADLGGDDSKQSNLNGIEHKSKNNENDESNAANGHIVKEEYDRMPDLKMNQKQSLMKLQNANISSSESEEFDDEPLVLAAPKPIVHKIKSPKITKPKIEKIDKMMEPIDMTQTKKEQINEIEKENALNKLMQDLKKEDTEKQKSKSISPKAETANEEHSENESLSEDEAEKKRKKEEKKRRKKERKERKKKRKKKKRKKKEKDNDIVEFDDSDEY